MPRRSLGEGGLHELAEHVAETLDIGPGTRVFEVDCGDGAFLLTSNREVLPFYARFGFSVANELAVPGGPPIWSLWRRP